MSYVKFLANIGKIEPHTVCALRHKSNFFKSFSVYIFLLIQFRNFMSNMAVNPVQLAEFLDGIQPSLYGVPEIPDETEALTTFEERVRGFGRSSRTLAKPGTPRRSAKAYLELITNTAAAAYTASHGGERKLPNGWTVKVDPESDVMMLGDLWTARPDLAEVMSGTAEDTDDIITRVELSNARGAQILAQADLAKGHGSLIVSRGRFAVGTDFFVGGSYHRDEAGRIRTRFFSMKNVLENGLKMFLGIQNLIFHDVGAVVVAAAEALLKIQFEPSGKKSHQRPALQLLAVDKSRATLESQENLGENELVRAVYRLRVLDTKMQEVVSVVSASIVGGQIRYTMELHNVLGAPDIMPLSDDLAPMGARLMAA